MSPLIPGACMITDDFIFSWPGQRIPALRPAFTEVTTAPASGSLWRIAYFPVAETTDPSGVT
jgi:hypothetical protein